MEFGMYGINCKEAPLEIRELFSFTDSRKIALSEQLYKLGVRQCMVVSTCNRSEVYYYGEANKEQLETLFFTLFSVKFKEEQKKYFNFKQGKEAISYLFQVAAGLQSMVIGEDQILGQIQEALSFSKAMGYTGKELHKIVRDAVTGAKAIKDTYKISEIPLSISYIGIKKLEAECGIKGKKVCILGSGKMAVLALHYVFDYGAQQVFLCSRNYEHALLVKKEFPAIIICPYEERYQQIPKCEIVISATKAPHLVIKQEEYKAAGEQFLLDLASPRDIDYRISQKENVHLYNIDALKPIAEENLDQRRILMSKAQEQVTKEVEKTVEWLHLSHMDTTIESLQQRCTEIEEDGFSYINRKIELDSHDKKVIKNTLHACLQRMLREPIHGLKELDTREQQEEYQRVIKNLFQL